MSRHSSRTRFAVTILGAASTCAFFIACTLTQSLDYLTKGDGDVSVPDVSAPDVPVVAPEGGGPNKNVLIANLTKPGLLAQDDLSLYWVSGGNVFSALKTGGTPKMLGTAPAAASLAAETDPNGAVFLAVGNDVVRLPKSGIGSATVFKGPAGSPLADTVAVDGTSLFVLQYDQVVAESFLLRMAKDGGAPVNMAADSGPAVMTTDTNNLVWLDPAQDNGTFYDLPKTAVPGTPGKALPVTADDDVPAASENLTTDDTTLYWVTDGNVGTPGIFSRKRDPAAPVIALFRGDTQTFGMVTTDATHVYAIEISAGAVVRVTKQGGSPETLLSGLPVPRGIVVDATSYYVTVEAVGNMGYILKMKK